MNYCNDKIDELLKKATNRLNENETTEKKWNEVSSEHVESSGVNNSDSKCTVNTMINNIVQMVKLCNHLSEISFCGSVLEGQKNAEKIKEVENDLSKIVWDISLYSGSESTRELLRDQSFNNCSDLENNYPFVSSVLEDIITRSYDSFKFFDNEFQTTSIRECYMRKSVQKNKKEEEEEEEEDEKEDKKERKEKNEKKETLFEKSRHGDNVFIKGKESFLNEKENLNTLNNNTNLVIKEHNLIHDKNQNQDQDKDQDKDQFQNQNPCQDENSIHKVSKNNTDFSNTNKWDYTKYENDVKVMPSILDTFSKTLNDGTVGRGKQQSNLLQKKDNRYILKNYLNKIQNAWLHLTNNYASFFIPRMNCKHNSLKDFDKNLKEAIQIQERYIFLKKKIMRFVETHKKEGYVWTVGDIVKESVSFFEENEKWIQEDTESLDNEYKSDCSDGFDDWGEYSLDVENQKVADEYFFIKFLEKVNKDLNRFRYKFRNLKNPYEYEINHIIQMYQNDDANVHTFLSLHKLEKVVPFSEKKFVCVDTKEKLTEMINNIKEHCKLISLLVKINFKKSYLGFIALVYIGTKEVDYLIDTFPIFEELTELNEITSNPNILKITYDSSNMLKFLQKDFSVYIVNMLDIFVAASYLNVYNNSLSFLLSNYFNININEIEKNTCIDLLSRPLTHDVITGVRKEFHYLFYLPDYVKMDLYFNFEFSRSDNGPARNTTRTTAKKEGKEEKTIKEEKEKKEKKEGQNKKQIRKEKGETETTEVQHTHQSNTHNRGNIYINFQKMDCFDILDEEMERTHNIIKSVFVESNKMCLEKYGIPKMYSISETKKKIENIIKGSYTYKDHGALIENLLIWRKKLSKKIDEAPDSILNIHNIVSIVLNVPTSISSLKNNIVPLSNVVMDNIEQLFNVISKSILQKKKPRFYEQIVKRKNAYNDKNKEEESEYNSGKSGWGETNINMCEVVKMSHFTENTENAENIEIVKNAFKIETASDVENDETQNEVHNISVCNEYTGFIVSSNLHNKDSINQMGKNGEREEEKEGEGEEDFPNKNRISKKDKGTMYELEKTLFSSPEKNFLRKEPSRRIKNKKPKIRTNIFSTNDALKTSGRFVKQLNKLNKKIKRRKTEREREREEEKEKHRSSSDLKIINISTIKSIDKNKMNANQNERQKKTMMRTSYKQQYNIGSLKKGFSKNIMNEIS